MNTFFYFKTDLCYGQNLLVEAIFNHVHALF